jgi:hypothetical protein
MGSLPLLTVRLPVEAYLSHDALKDIIGRRGRVRRTIDSCSGVFRIEISPQRQAILLEKYLVVCSVPLGKAIFKKKGTTLSF